MSRQAGRRMNGEGSVYQRADGRWVATANIGGSRRAFYGHTAEEARDRRTAAQGAVARGAAPVADGRVTLTRFVEDTYIPVSMASRVRGGRLQQSTAEWYAGLLRTHVLPVLGGTRVDQVRPSDIEVLLLGLDGSQSLARGVYTAIRQALTAAVREGIAPTNVALSVDRPTVGHEEAHALTAAELAALLEAADPTMTAALWVLALTGLRRGELLGLTWGDVDLSGQTARVAGAVRRTRGEGLTRAGTKSGRVRVVSLSAPAVEALRAHREAQPTTPLPSAPVFPGPAGGWWDPRAFSRAFEATATAAGVEATPHALRHSAATELLTAGVPVHVVAEVLGHADARVTMEVYAHVRVESRAAAMDALAARLAGGAS